MFMYELNEEVRDILDNIMNDIMWTVDVPRYKGENTVEGVKGYIRSVCENLDLSNEFQKDLYDKIKKYNI